MIPEIKKILYATDLSENARYAFRYAISIANRYDAKITIIHVLEELPAGSTSLVSHIVGEDRWEELKEKNEQQVLDTIKIRVEKFCEEFDLNDSECQFNIEDIIVRIGHPANEILAHANEVPYDMVVLGTRGLGMFAEVMMGSTARQVVRRCNKPVLTIRMP